MILHKVYGEMVRRMVHKNHLTDAGHFPHDSNDSEKLKSELTFKEQQIIEYIVEGKTNKQIAQILCLSEGRVRNIITDIFNKLKVKDRTQLAVFAVKNDLV